MAKRFGDTDIWKKQRWFRKLNPEYKLAFCYIKDQCNHAGIWKVDCADLIEDLGLLKFDLSFFIDAINTEYDKITGDKITKERVVLLKDNTVWITGFVQFQYEGKDELVKVTNNMVKGAFLILDSIKFNPCQPLPTLANPSAKTTLLEQGLNQFYIKTNQGLAVLRQGLATLKEKERGKDNIVKLQKNENSKFSGNFKSQGEEFFLNRIEDGIEKLRGNRTTGN